MTNPEISICSRKLISVATESGNPVALIKFKDVIDLLSEIEECHKEQFRYVVHPKFYKILCEEYGKEEIEKIYIESEKIYV